MIGSLGDMEKVQYTQAAGAMASTAVGAAATTGLLASSAAGPIGLAIAGTVIGLSLLFGRKGGQQKITASNNANEIEPYMQQNLANYMASPRTISDKGIGLDNYDYLWNQFVSIINSQDLGDAGRRGIEERGRNGRPPWGKNWFELYRDPIEQDTPTNTGVSLVNSIMGSGGGIDLTKVLSIGALVVGGLLLFSGERK